jgi:roadblock/LC7 domain-containing protein
VRQTWRPLLVLLVTGGLLLTAIDVVLIHGAFLRGVVVGGGGAALLAAVAFVVVQVTGTAARSMGATAEQWTASELRGLRRRGWRLVNGFVLSGGDTDHVLVGPAGVFVLESKWSADTWASERAQARIRQALDQVQANARRMRLWDPVKKSGLPVQPVLVLWGRALDTANPTADISGVTVLRGRSAIRAWCDATAGSPPAPAAERTDAVWRAIQDQAARRDAYERRVNPPPLSVDRLLSLAFAVVISAIAGALAISEVGTHVESPWWAIIAVALILAALPPMRWPGGRALASGWIAGIAGTVLIVALRLLIRAR